MFKKTALVAGIGLALSIPAHADFQWQVDAGYARGSYDFDFRNIPGEGNTGDSIDTDVYNIGGTYFLETVDTSKGPLGEAAFLDHASSLALGFTDGDVDFNGGDDGDGQTYNVDMRYVAEGPGWKLSGVIVDVNFERAEPGDLEIDTWGLGIGYYITQNTTVVANYDNVSVNNRPDPHRWGLDVEHFFAFGNGGLMARANGGKTVISGLDDPTTWGLGATWYLNNNLGFGADYVQDEENGFEVQGFRVNAEWFITESLAVDLSYTDIQPDDISDPRRYETLPIFGGKLEQSYNEIGISALYRF